MKATDIVTAIAKRPAAVELIPQKGWGKLAGPHGAKLYVKNPTADGEFSVAQVSGWGYSGLPEALALPASMVEQVTDNGAVSLEVDLRQAPADWLARAIAHLESQVAEPSPRNKPRAKRASRPTLADMVAQATASAAAHSDATPAAAQDAILMVDEEVVEAIEEDASIEA